MSQKDRRNTDPWNNNIKPRLLEITAWARDGALDADIAKRLGIAYSTFKRHKLVKLNPAHPELGFLHPELSEALRVGKDVADVAVENALYKRAIGYSYNEITQEIGAGNVLQITKAVKKEVVPDVAAIMSWLTNRRRDKWKHRQIDDMDNAEALAKLDGIMSKVNEAMVVPAIPQLEPSVEEVKPDDIQP